MTECMGRHAAAATSTGLVRKRNEDSACAGRWLYAVADGLGGHIAGDVASATVIRTLSRCDREVNDPAQLPHVLGDAINEASGELAAAVGLDPAFGNMGTTLTAMLWSGRDLVIANIGDSRAYLLRGGELSPITEDHVMAHLVANPSPPDIGEIIVRYLDGRPGRSPDLTRRAAKPGDRYLICSDGLSGVLARHVVRDVLVSVEDPDHAVVELIRLTTKAGAPDNVALVIVDVLSSRSLRAGAVPVILGAPQMLRGV
jgi:PPM family protein phosphatase